MSTPPPLPAAVVAFIDAHIFTMAQLEVLLLVHDADGDVRTVADLALESYLPAASIAPWLDDLVARGVLEASDGGYRFAPADEALRKTLHEVADTYSRRRVSLTRHVYTSKEDPVVRFADAFRFRKDRDS